MAPRYSLSPYPTNSFLVLLDAKQMVAGRHAELKLMLKRIVSTLTRLIARADAVFEPAVEYKYRFAEYEGDCPP